MGFRLSKKSDLDVSLFFFAVTDRNVPRKPRPVGGELHIDTGTRAVFSGGFQIFFKPCQDLLPAIHGSMDAVARSVH